MQAARRQALQVAAANYVASKGLHSEEAEIDISMELVQRVTVLVD